MIPSLLKLPPRRCKSPTTIDSRSLISGEIWLGDSLGVSSGFTRDVRITGWSNVGDKLGGAYVGKLMHLIAK